METWKPVLGLEEFYEVSDLGNVRSFVRKGKTQFGVREYGGKVVKPFISSTGYPAINLTKKGYRKQYLLHRIVLETFIGQPSKGMEGCHNDGNKENCKLSNLRWDTRKNNHKDQKLHGTKQKIGKKINEEIALEIKELNEKLTIISKKYNLSRIQIWRIKTNRAWN